MKRLVSCLMSLVLAIGLMPLPAYAQGGEGVQAGRAPFATVQDSAGARAVEEAFNKASEYAANQAFKAPALKDALEHQLPDALCYSVSPDEYYVVYQGGAYRRASNGSVVAVAPDEQLPVYDSVEAARDASANDEAFITRGLADKNDKGHGYYVRSDGDLPHESVSAGAPDGYGKRKAGVECPLDVTIGDNGYWLTSFESALSIFQLGYTPGSDAASYIQAFENTSFHTLTIPEGEYRLGGGVWLWRNDSAVYGFGATLYTDDDFEKNDLYNAVWYVRGEIDWFHKADPYGWVRGHETNGLSFERRTTAGHVPGFGYGVFMRNAHDVTLRNVSFVDDNDEGITCYECYGNCSDVSLIDCVGRSFGTLELRDLCNQNGRTFYSLGDESYEYRGGCHDIVVRRCDFTMWSHDEGIAIFTGNEEGLKNSDGVEWPILKDCMLENLTIEDSEFTFEKPRNGRNRVVAITCGYQDSPVKNVTIRNNRFNAFADYYFMQFGYALGATFENNEVVVHSVESGGLLALFERSNHSRTGPTEDILVKKNRFSCADDAKLTRVLDRELGEQATFTENELTVSGKVEKLLDSPAHYIANTFSLHDVGSLYSDVRDVSGNTYTIGELGSLFEGNGVNAGADIVISNEHAQIAEIPNHLMGFYGSGSYAPRFNGHALTFVQCDYEIASAPYQWRRIAYDTSAIADEVVLTLWDCNVPGFQTGNYKTIDKNESGKVKLQFMNGSPEDSPGLFLGRVESRSGDENFADITDAIAFECREPLDARAFGSPSGSSAATFTLSSDELPEYAEVRLLCGEDIADDGDIAALYHTSPGEWDWQCFGYYPVVDGGFTFEVGSEGGLGTFGVVNKSRLEEFAPVDLSTLDAPSAAGKLFGAMEDGKSVKASDAMGRIDVGRRYMDADGQYASHFELYSLDLRCTDTTDNNGLTFAAGGPNDFYFEDCTFDHLDFTFLRQGTYAFVNCVFENNPRNAIAAQASDAKVFLYGCTFKDNAPNREVWNQDISGDRHAKYAAVRLRGDGTALHAADCAFENLQTDSTIIVERKGEENYDGVEVCFERNRMTDCGGAGLVLDNQVRGRIDGNEFANIGATRGMNGYRSTIHPTLGEYASDGSGLPGAGVGGNAVFGRGRNLQMRVRDNTCKNLMENAIEGTYYCISGNHVDTTGYRYDDASGDSYNGGYKTVSTEGIAAVGTWYVTDNEVLNVHGRGISVSHWRNGHPIVVSGNTVTRRADGNRAYDTSEGIKIRTDESSWANVTVKDNKLQGFENNYRVLHADGARTCENVTIDDANDGRIMGPVYSNLRGVKLVTARDRELALDARSEQTIELPDKLCIVCLELQVKSAAPTVNVKVNTSNPAYNTNLPLERIADGGLITTYACFKAVGATTVKLSSSDGGPLEVASVNGWYEAEPDALAYPLTYDLGGGVQAPSNPSSYTSEDEVMLAEPTRAGYSFAGWTGTDLSESTLRVVIPAGSIGSRHFVASWAPIAEEQGSERESGSGSGSENGLEASRVPSSSNSAESIAVDEARRVPEGASPAYLGSMPIVIYVESGKVTLRSASKAKGTVKVSVVTTPDGQALGVDAIAAKAFAGSQATRVVIGDTVKSIGKEAFKNCKKLKSVTVGKGVKTIGASAFRDCKKLSAMVLGKNAKSVGKAAFKGCKKLKTLKVRSAKLTRKSCKQMLKGSKVKTVKLVGMSKAQKKKVAAKYLKWLPNGVVVK